MTKTMTRTRPSILHFLVALSFSLSYHPCVCTENGSSTYITSYCPTIVMGTETFSECGEPAGRCICQDHTAYCNVSSPALPVLPDHVHILDMCNNYFGDVHSLDGDTLQLTSQFFSHMENVTELRIMGVDIRPEAFVLLANLKKVSISCDMTLSIHFEHTWRNFYLIPNLRSLNIIACNQKIVNSLHPGLQSPVQSFSADLCYPDFKTLDLKVFQMFKDLKRISFTDCWVEQVLSAELPALEEVILEYNKLTTFPQTCDVKNNSFFPSLKHISLARNKISHVGGNGSSACLPQVTEIDVSANPITSIQKGVFDARSCPKLETINLSNVRETSDNPPTIHTEGFIFANPSIKTLDLTNNGWPFGSFTSNNRVAQNTFANSSLTHLILDGNDFNGVYPRRFFELFGSLRNLTHLSLRDIRDFPFIESVTDHRFCAFKFEYLMVSEIIIKECYTPTVLNKRDGLCKNSAIKTFNADNLVILITPPQTDKNLNERNTHCAAHFQFYMLEFALIGSAVEQLSFRGNNLDFGNRCMDFKSSCFLSESFENKPSLRVLLLDENDFSNVDAERFVSLFGKLTNLEHLSLSNCGIKYVFAEMFRSFPRLQYLDLSNNKLNTLSSQTFSALPSLTVLYLHGNVLSAVPEGLFSSDQRSRRKMTKFTLYQNPLVCSCDNRWLQSWLLSDPDLFDYPSQSYSCKDDPTKSVANYTMPDQACMLGQDAATAIIITCTVTIAALTGFSLLFRYRWNFRLLLYYALSKRDKSRARRRNYVYDLFVSYDQENFPWVRHQLMPELEDRLGLRLCIHQRDFIPGHYIVTNIAQAVEHSKKVLMVFSRHFVLSRWCQFEVDFCLSHAIENRESLLIVCLDDVASDETLLTGAMKAALSTMTYIQWVNRPDAVHFFWERVGQSLGDVRPRDREAGRRRQREVLDIDARVRIEMQVMDF